MNELTEGIDALSERRKMGDQKSKYKLIREKDGEAWINLPNNGGDIGGLDEIVLVLNKQHDKILELERELKQSKLC